MYLTKCVDSFLCVSLRSGILTGIYNVCLLATVYEVIYVRFCSFVRELRRAFKSILLFLHFDRMTRGFISHTQACQSSSYYWAIIYIRLIAINALKSSSHCTSEPCHRCHINPKTTNQPTPERRCGIMRGWMSNTTHQI